MPLPTGIEAKRRDVLALFLLIIAGLGFIGSMEQLYADNLQQVLAFGGSGAGLIPCGQNPSYFNYTCNGQALASCGGFGNLIQCGTKTCTVTSIACTLTITFSPAFKTTPTIFQPTITSVSPINPRTITTGSNLFPISPLLFSSAPQVWTTLPTTDAPTEIFGTTNNRLQAYLGISSVTQTWNFCVTTITASSNSTATLGLQTANGQSGPWTDFGSSAFRVNIGTVSNGLSCAQESISQVTGFITFRVVGRDGFGVGDNPQFGNIFAYISQITGVGAVNVPDTPFTQVNTRSASSVSMQVVFPGVPLSAETVTIVWKAIQ